MGDDRVSAMENGRCLSIVEDEVANRFSFRSVGLFVSFDPRCGCGGLALGH